MVGTRYFFAACLLVSAALVVVAGIAIATRPPRAVPPEATAGSRLWRTQGCEKCHSLFGQGGLSAPDLTQIYSQHPLETLHAFLTTPSNDHPRLSFLETVNLLTFLRWVSEQSPDWPPAPLLSDRLTP